MFLHGGPGFNSIAEEAMLGPVCKAAGHEMLFWNEPSPLRPEGDPFEATDAFDCWMASAERFALGSAGSDRIHLLAHSCTVHAAMEIARGHAPRVASLTLIAPVIDLLATFRNVLRIAHEDLVDSHPSIAAVIADCLERTRAVLDDALREGLQNALHDRQLLTHYFADADQFRKAMSAAARPEAQFDVESFFAVLAGFGERLPALLLAGPVTVPTLVLFGARDPVTRVSDQSHRVRAAIPHCRIDVLDHCSHYVHLDRPDRFMHLLVDWIDSVSTPVRAT